MVPCTPFKFAESQVKARVPNSKEKILTNRRLNFDLPRAKLRQLAGEFALLADQRADRNLLYKKVAAHIKIIPPRVRKKSAGPIDILHMS